MVTAHDFRTKFVNAYLRARQTHSGDWEATWTDTARWSNLMVYDADAVVRRVASDLGFNSHPGEPMRFDAIFVTKETPRWEWFPLIVAVEHENNPRTFGGEIKKLLSIRCPLKVGITYRLLGDGSDAAGLRTKITSDIRELFATIKANISEDADAEYLFLLGDEESERELQWYYISFRSGDGPKIDQNFEPVPFLVES